MKLCSWAKRLNFVKMSILSKLIYFFNVIPTKMLVGLFVAIDKLILKFTMKCKEHGIAKTTFKKKSKDGGLALLDFMAY